jgi:hypothetical protein
MWVQIWQRYWDKPVKLIKTKFKFRCLSVKQQTHVEILNYLLHYCETNSFIFEDEEQKSSYKVHALAVI